MRPKKLAARRGRSNASVEEFLKRIDADVTAAVVADEDVTAAVIPDDDCPVVDDDADDELKENGNHEDDDGVDDANEETEPPEAVPTEEEVSSILASRFGEDVRRDAEESDGDSADDIWDDEKIPDPMSEEDEDDIEEDVRREDDEDPYAILALGKTFNDSYGFKSALLRYSLKTGYDLKLFISNGMKCSAVCSDKVDNCPWKIYCSYERKKHKLQIKTFVNEHCCVQSGYTKLLKRKTIADLFEERLRVNPKFLPREIVDEIKRSYNMIVTEDQCRKAKTIVFKRREATHEAHFSKIWDYQAEIWKSNPGTTLEIETVPGPTVGSKQRFHRIFVCFKAQREAWLKNCRPIIGLDGAFLKWDIKGHLLAAVGRDGDNRIVPIAWAVVEIENDDNWDWFVRHIRNELRLGDGSNVAVISDKQQGLVKAIHNVLPQGEHRLCARHILGNWKRDNTDKELERIFWKIARAYTKGEYTAYMNALMRFNKGAYDSLQKHSPELWSRAHFRVGSLCNDVLNNLNESFNRTIREPRRKPLLEMLESIRRQVMGRTVKRNRISNRSKTRFTKSAHIEIENAKTKAKDCIRYLATGDRHEVDLHGNCFCVDMNLKTCGCGKWQLIGIPCPHATCVITAKKEHVMDYVSHFYTTATWRNTYKESIQPVESEIKWLPQNRLGVLPPGHRKGNPGRPSSHARRKSQFETASSSLSKTKLPHGKLVMTCSNCKQEGHNKLSCSHPTVPPPAKRPRGRPRKIQENTQDLSQMATSQGSQVPFSQGSHIGPSQRSQRPT